MFNYDEPLVLFDGFCNLCDSTVQFIIREDKNKLFKFASLQSELGASLINKFHLKSVADQSVILINNRKAAVRSKAVLSILMKLNIYFKIFAALIYIIPAPLRDFVYKYISKNRFKWFGKKEICMLPSKDLIDRFYS